MHQLVLGLTQPLLLMLRPALGFQARVRSQWRMRSKTIAARHWYDCFARAGGRAPGRVRALGRDVQTRRMSPTPTASAWANWSASESTAARRGAPCLDPDSAHLATGCRQRRRRCGCCCSGRKTSHASPRAQSHRDHGLCPCHGRAGRWQRRLKPSACCGRRPCPRLCGRRIAHRHWHRHHRRRHRCHHRLQRRRRRLRQRAARAVALPAA